MRLLFLHIPKTAGQSVHAALVKAFGEEAICPARVNDQLKGYSIGQLNRYKVFSGHLDWSLLDCVKGPKHVFTVLRNPLDRILSFYFFLRNQAATMTEVERCLPKHQGLQAAHDLSPDEYFMGGPGHLRRFLDDHYDNFYTYYFAGRRFESRTELLGLSRRGVLSEKQISEIAIDNLGALDAVFTLDGLGDVFSFISEVAGKKATDKNHYKVNVNSDLPGNDRVEALKSLGASEETLDTLNAFCSLDNKIWDLYR